MGDSGDEHESVAPIQPSVVASSSRAEASDRNGGAGGGRYVPPPTIKDSSIEELRRYTRKVRLWSKVATSIKPELRGIHAYYALLENSDDQIQCIVEGIDPETLEQPNGVDLIVQALESEILPKNVYEKFQEFELAFFGTERRQGESLQSHSMKIKKAFDRLKKLEVDLDDIQGYFLLRQAKLEHVERMTVILQTGGSLHYDKVREALKGLRDDQTLVKVTRDHQVPGAPKASKAYLAHELEGPEAHPEEDGEQDPIAMALQELETEGDAEDDEVLDEDEAYAVLAAWQSGPGGKNSWADSRKLNRDRKTSRGYRDLSGGKGGRGGKDFREDSRKKIEDLKKRTRCNKCGLVGHWHRECKNPGPPVKGEHARMVQESEEEEFFCGAIGEEGLVVDIPPPPAEFQTSDNVKKIKHRERRLKAQARRSAAAETAASAEEPRGHADFEESATDDLSRLRECMARAQTRLQDYPDSDLNMLLEGMVDTGCSRMVVGDETLALHDYALRKLHGRRIRYRPSTANKFHFANGEDTYARWVAEYPVGFGGKTGAIRLCVVKGSTPLLISEGLLEDLHGILDTVRGTVYFQKLHKTVNLRRSRAAPRSRQWRLPLTQYGTDGSTSSTACRTSEVAFKTDMYEMDKDGDVLPEPSTQAFSELETQPRPADARGRPLAKGPPMHPRSVGLPGALCVAGALVRWAGRGPAAAARGPGQPLRAPPPGLHANPAWGRGRELRGWPGAAPVVNRRAAGAAAASQGDRKPDARAQGRPGGAGPPLERADARRSEQDADPGPPRDPLRVRPRGGAEEPERRRVLGARALGPEAPRLRREALRPHFRAGVRGPGLHALGAGGREVPEQGDAGLLELRQDPQGPAGPVTCGPASGGARSPAHSQKSRTESETPDDARHRESTPEARMDDRTCASPSANRAPRSSRRGRHRRGRSSSMSDEK